MFWFMMETEHIYCDGQAVRCRIWLCNKNVCKRSKAQQQEEPAILDAIKSIVIKIINRMPLTSVLVYSKYAKFARSIGENVMIFNNNLV